MSDVRTPLPLWIYISAGCLAAVLVFLVVNTRPRHHDDAVWVAATSTSETKKPVPAVKTSKPKLPTIKGYTYPDARCVNGWPPASDWVGVGKLKNGKLAAVSAEDIAVWASSPEDDYDWMPNIDIYCPPGTKVPGWHP